MSLAHAAGTGAAQSVSHHGTMLLIVTTVVFRVIATFTQGHRGCVVPLAQELSLQTGR